MGCGGAHNSEQSGSAATGSKGPSESFSGLVGIGNGRKLYMECRGTGSPTVVLVSGTQGAFDEWTHAFDSSYRGAEPKAVGWAVFPRVAAMTRVCAYDHPGTTRLGGGLTPSTSVAQPTTARDGVADLHALLTAAGEPGPYVLVGASWGGVIVKLYASTYPEEVVGLVFVDGASDLLKETFTPAQWAGWMQKIEASASNRRVSRPRTTSRASRRSSLRPRCRGCRRSCSPRRCRGISRLAEGPPGRAWLQAQDRLATEFGAKHITNTHSGHPIALEQPQLVIDAIRAVVDEVRSQ